MGSEEMQKRKQKERKGHEFCQETGSANQQAGLSLSQKQEGHRGHQQIILTPSNETITYWDHELGHIPDLLILGDTSYERLTDTGTGLNGRWSQPETQSDVLEFECVYNASTDLRPLYVAYKLRMIQYQYLREIDKPLIQQYIICIYTLMI